MDWIWLLAVGLLAGIISATLGVGGGILMTPVLHYLFHYSWSQSVAISLFAIALQSPVGVWQHARCGKVDWKIGGTLAVAGILGIALGDWLLPRTPVTVLKLLFAAAILFAAYRLTKSVQPHAGKATTPFVAGLGFIAGILSRILGIGGGLVTVPALVFRGVAVHIAAASSLVPVFTNAALATGANLGRDLIMWPALLLGAGAFIGAPLGAKLSHSLPALQLQRLFALGLTAMAIVLTWDALT